MERTAGDPACDSVIYSRDANNVDVVCIDLSWKVESLPQRDAEATSDVIEGNR